MDPNKTPPPATEQQPPPSQETTPPKETTPPPAEQKPAEQQQTKTGEQNEETNPLFNKPTEQQKEGEAPKQETQPPTELSDEDFAKGITVDEGAEYTFDDDLIKEMVPHLKEAGLDTAKATKLANEFTKAQYERMKAERQAEYTARQERIKTWKPWIEQQMRENPRFAEEVNAGVDAMAKLDPVVSYLYRETEVGFSPAFLTLAALKGREMLTDGGIGTNAGPGESKAGWASTMSNGLI